MKRLIAVLLGSGMVLAGPAAAQQSRLFDPNSFRDVAYTFKAADLDRNGAISSDEYVMLHTSLVDRNAVRHYRGDGYRRTVPTVVSSFSRLDRNDDGMISRTEFMNTANNSSRTGAADETPEYMTLTYYLTANPIDADTFRGRQVVNLEGEEIGTIRSISHLKNSDKYYAIVSVSDRVLDPTPSPYRMKTVGVPLEDLLLASDGASLLLSQRGEEYFLGDQNRPRVNVDRLEPVERIYGV